MAEKQVKMFLDDIRSPSWVFKKAPDNVDSSWVIVRSFNQAKSWVETNGCPDLVSFDHDLGLESLDGYEFAKWLTEADLDGHIEIPEHFQWNVHSANPVAESRITPLLMSYLKFKEQERVNKEAATAVSK